MPTDRLQDTSPRATLRADEGAQAMTTTEAARMLGVSPSTVRRAVHAGKLPARRWTTLWLLLRPDVEAFASRTETAGTPSAEPTDLSPAPLRASA